MLRAQNIDMMVYLWIFQGCADSGTGRKVNDNLRAYFADDVAEGARVTDVCLEHAKGGMTVGAQQV